MIQIALVLKLKDSPGALLEALKPISEHGGNIVSIIHLREEKKGEDVPAVINFQVSDSDQLNDVLKGVGETARIIEVRKDGKLHMKKKSFSVILVGHIMESNAKDTLDRLMAAGAGISNFELDMDGKESHSTAIMKIDVEKKDYSKIREELKKISREKSLLMVREIS